jgi:hypothetical protein
VWVYAVLTVLCLVIGMLHLLRLVSVRRDAAAESSCTAMALGMAGMFSPVGDPVPVPVWVAIFVGAGSWFAASVLRRGSEGDAAHHVVGSVAMLFMLAEDHAAARAGGDEHAAHAAHGGGGLDLLSTAAAAVLAAYFVWYTLRCTDRWRACRAPEPGGGLDVPAGGGVALRAPASGLRSARLAAVAHVAMAVLMTIMLLGMI